MVTASDDKSGVYRVEESGLEFQHGKEGQPTTPDQFLASFRNGLELNVLENPSPNELVFELINVDTSFANALRRILLAEVPTVALETVYIWENSSILHDETLSHRLGLIPLQVDARLLDEPEEDFTPTDRNTVVMSLSVACPKIKTDPDSNEMETDQVMEEDDDEEEEEDAALHRPDLEAMANEAAAAAASSRPVQYPKDRPYTKHVYSRDLVWVPQGDQQQRWQDQGIRPVHDDILIAKLRPGQSISLEAHARRGIGKDHAKFSPVATASYRLKPHIELVKDVYDDLADELANVYEPGVFEVVPTDPSAVTDPPGTTRKARVVNPYACTMSRNYMRHDELRQAIVMTRLPNHFIFSVESVGCYPSAAVVVAEALRILQRKCQRVQDLCDQSQT